MKKVIREAGWGDVRGFTMIELISVLLIIAIVTAVAVSRVDSIATYSLKSQTEVIKDHLRYAQARSMGSSIVFGIQLDSTSSYHLFTNGDATQAVILPGEDTSPVIIPGGVTVAPKSPTTTTLVSFDNWGRPYTNQDASGNASAANLDFLVGGTELITITKNTGFIP